MALARRFVCRKAALASSPGSWRDRLSAPHWRGEALREEKFNRGCTLMKSEDVQMMV
jgi:hypothetical protein